MSHHRTLRGVSREGEPREDLEKIAAEKRSKEARERARKNGARDKRRTYKRTGEKGIKRKIAGMQEKRNKAAGIVSNELLTKTTPVAKPLSTNLKKGFPTYAPFINNQQIKKAVDLAAAAEKKARAVWRAIMRQIKKVVYFAERHGKDAKDVFCALISMVICGIQKICVRKYQETILQL